MMNPITCVCVLMAAGSGLYLFQEKQQVQMLDRNIEQVLHAADAAHARVGMLRAEYALLNDPSRLQDLARQHLPALANTAPTQFANLADIDRRLPNPASESGPSQVATDAAAPLVVVAAPPPVAAMASVPPPRPTPLAHAAVATIAPAALAAVASLSPLLPHAPRAAAHAGATRLASRRPAGQRVAFAVHGNPYPTRPVVGAEALPRVVAHASPAEPGSPVIASALGMARSMMASGTVGPTIPASFSGGAPSP